MSYIAKILGFGNNLFTNFFNFLPNLFGEDNDSVKLLIKYYKNYLFCISLTIFAFILYWTFGMLNTGRPDYILFNTFGMFNSNKNDYIESSIWFWIIMFSVLMIFIKVKPPI